MAQLKAPNPFKEEINRHASTESLRHSYQNLNSYSYLNLQLTANVKKKPQTLSVSTLLSAQDFS